MEPQRDHSSEQLTEKRGNIKINKGPPLGIADKEEIHQPDKNRLPDKNQQIDKNQHVDKNQQLDKNQQPDKNQQTDKIQFSQSDKNPTSPPEVLTAPINEIRQFRCCLTADRLNVIKKKVEDSINERKTFTIKGGFQSIRMALVQRGWIEKIELRTPHKNNAVFNIPTLDDICCNLPPRLDGESINTHIIKCEKMVISRLLQNHDVDFYWNLRKDSNEWQHRLNRNKIINRFSRSLFTSKEGLCLLLQQMYWHNEPGISYVRFPRCYTINFADQCSAFIEDFRLTACISLLKYFVQKIQITGEQSIYSNNGKVPTTALQFAIDRCNEYIAVQKHVDLDKEFLKTWDHEWEQFLTNFQLIVHNNEKFEDGLCFPLLSLESSAKSVLKNIQPFWPQLELDGIKNIWILKPGNKCRGRDITLIKDINPVIRIMNSKMKYVVQKYIERPLLIHKTKFDIRQWFLITSVQPLTIWMYRDCYLRFSSQIFNLDNFHESVHLTNHAVQHKYANQERDRALPDDNMWDNHTFKTYLRQIGQAEKWYKVVYPGMRECIIGAMLASQDTMDRRPNTFELYGADFMVAENFTPWLIEINSCPAMGPTTSVTARMCPQCFEDLVKVIVDRRKDPKADTGLFELIYKQSLPQSPAYLGMTLSVRGRRIFKKKTHSKTRQTEQLIENGKSQTMLLKPKPSVHVELVKNYNGPIIGNLIEELHETLFKKEEHDISPGRDESPPTMKLVMHSTKYKSPTVSQKTEMFPCKYSSNNKLVPPNRKARESFTANTKRTPLSTRNKKPVRLGKSAASSVSIATTWEQETASILKNNTLLSKNSEHFNTEIQLKPSPPTTDLVNDCYISSIKKILPEIDTKHSNTPNLYQNLYTVGLGYRNHLFKNIAREDIMLPLGNQSSLDVYCFKL